MKKNSKNVVWRSLLFNSFVVSGILSFKCDRAFSQITPDNTLGAESSVVNSRDATSESIDGGAVRGQNLFHSFEEFNVGEDRGVYFANPDAVTNIFSRVTGNDVSNILGTLGVDGAANLYLINPNGIVFGKGASLDVQGSFTATTADAIEFGKQGFFSASDPEAPKLLTINPSAYLFNQVAPGEIANNSKASADFNPDTSFDDGFFGLRVPDGQSLLLLGGDIKTDGGGLVASGGRIDLGAIAGEGVVGLNANGSLNIPDSLSRGDVSLTNGAGFLVAGDGGGDLAIAAKDIRIDSASSLNAGILTDLGSPDAQAGDITINAAGSLTLTAGFISTSPSGVGNAGDLKIDTKNLIVQNSQVSASTFGKGNGGNLTIRASESVKLSGELAETNENFRAPGGLFAQVDIAEGKGGNLTIDTQRLSVSDGSKIQVATFGKGDAGKLTIRASQIDIFDTEERKNGFSTGIFAGIIQDPFRSKELPVGNGGQLNINTDRLSIIGGGRVEASNSGIGKAGDIFITAKDLVEVVGSSSLIAANVAPQNSSNPITPELISGDGGNVTINTSQLIVRDGAEISVSTFGQGDAGNLSIFANKIQIDGGEDGLITGFLAQVREEATGKGGSINIGSEQSSVEQLSIINGAEISVSSLGEGKAGELGINANALNLDNNAVISSQSESAFEAGDITLNIANSLEAKDSEISTNSTQSSGGNLTIAADDIQLRGNSDITTNIFSGEGSGGNIDVKADSVIAFDDSDIFASAPEGQGGNINLNTPAFFAENFTLNSLTTKNTDILRDNNRADINATGRESGTVAIPDVSFIQNSLTELENNSINTDELVANSCVSPVGDRQQGKFIITGGQSLPVRPGDGIPSKYPTGEVRNVPESNHSSWQSGDPIVEPQGAYRLANGKLVLSRECSN